MADTVSGYIKCCDSFEVLSEKILEAPPDYHFTKLLAKQHSGQEHEELVLACSLNNYRAPVAWYRDKLQLGEDGDRVSIDKDITGSCRLTLRDPTKADAGRYSCRIVGREKEKNCFTKTEVVIKGRLRMRRAWVHHISVHLLFKEAFFLFCRKPYHMYI